MPNTPLWFDHDQLWCQCLDSHEPYRRWLKCEQTDLCASGDHICSFGHHPQGVEGINTQLPAANCWLREKDRKKEQHKSEYWQLFSNQLLVCDCASRGRLIKQPVPSTWGRSERRGARRRSRSARWVSASSAQRTSRAVGKSKRHFENLEQHVHASLLETWKKKTKLVRC